VLDEDIHNFQSIIFFISHLKIMYVTIIYNSIMELKSISLGASEVSANYLSIIIYV